MSDRIATYAKTKALVQNFDFRFKKNLGQNFLIDEHVLQKIIAAAEITPDDYVIEVGPGAGSLTQPLCEAAGKVTAVEIDSRLVPILSESLKDYPNLEILNRDILKTDVARLIGQSGYPSAKMVANLPYYITTPVIMDFLEKKYPITDMVVMVQKEVAERMKAKPGTKDYGALSLAVQYRAEPYIAAYVPQNCFMPRPNVDSAVVRLKVLKTPAFPIRDEKLLFGIIKAAFGQRRKTLVNALVNSAELDFTKEQATTVLKECGLDENVRGEALSLAEFCEIANRF